MEKPYRVFGYKGKQVRDNIHAHDVASFIHEFVKAPRIAEVYNLGGGKDNSCSVLEASQDNLLLHAIVSATHGADTELLPLLTTHAGALLSTAKAVVVDRVAPYDVALTPAELDAAIDLIVRVALSHVMQPSASPQATADDIAWLSAHVLQG